MKTAMRRVLIAAMAILDESRCCCSACVDLHAYAARWIRDHAAIDYTPTADELADLRRPRQWRAA